MNLYGRVLSLIGVVLAGLLSLGLLALAAGGISLAVSVSDVLQGLARGFGGRALLALAGVAVMFAVAYILMRSLGIGAGKVLAFDSPSGHMEVDISALEACLTRTALDIDDVVDARAKVHIQPGGLAKPVLCTVQVGLRERSDVPGKGSEIGTCVKERFLDIIPIDTAPIINLNIRIRPRKEVPASGAAERAEPAAQTEATVAEDVEELEDAPDFTGQRDYSDGDKGGG